MKKCPKCGHKNDNDANFCSNCREKLEEKVSRVDQSSGKKKKTITVIASIFLILVLGIIAVFLFTRNNDQTTTATSNSGTESSKKSSLTAKQKSESTTKKEATANSKKETDKLVVNKLTPQQTAAAIIYYGVENVKPYDTWKELYDANSINVYITKRLISNLDKPGQGIRYALIKDTNTSDENYIGPSYTLSADNTVNYYSFNGFGGQRSTNSEQSVALDTIIKYINDNNDLATINKLAEKISVEDKRAESSSNTITIDDYNQDQLLKYKALILYGINHCEEWRALRNPGAKFIVTSGGPLITITLDQAGGGFQIAETAATDGAKNDRYVFGGADIRTGKFLPGTNTDGRVGLISSKEVIDYANQSGGKQRLDEMNVEIQYK
ncbi:zinc ribbon domain-containing protein [Ligilactobacillus apodemi]|uniref:Zinc-ribbon domain-containing protein n=1 Tax=Ligilactobacillus apodemi DSM 16634 = JCM 16172 TaxID=1423724 RepID=A0A0R1U4B3_9LACO|nr:zinc ribbon domain-containing protein [Ligilactobacillus apodemi]KRL86163.1 hypothetical protein FC32_GL001874 [Ligilactobacillus apodemi DSM 16634 = JCM 16172]